MSSDREGIENHTMDLRHTISVVRAHRSLAIGGLVAALLLALLAFAKLDFSSSPFLERREPVIYSSTTRLFVTQPGFPWGRTTPEYSEVGGQPVPAEDQSRLSGFAVLYAQLANSREIQRSVIPNPRRTPNDKVAASFVSASVGGLPLPLVDITAQSTAPGRSQVLADEAARSLVTYIRTGQSTADTPVSARVLVEVITPAEPGKAVGTNVPTLPIIVFLTVALATLGLIFIVHNLRSQAAPSLETVGPASAPDERASLHATDAPQQRRVVAAAPQVRSVRERAGNDRLGES